uniref:Maspardin n=2 Tax=Macaca mulatta TaxID=9544 RepID=A0A5F8AC91_MACMU|nr:maspardin isoform X1 [Macaca mulatta]
MGGRTLPEIPRTSKGSGDFEWKTNGERLRLCQRKKNVPKKRVYKVLFTKAWNPKVSLQSCKRELKAEAGPKGPGAPFSWVRRSDRRTRADPQVIQPSPNARRRRGSHGADPRSRRRGDRRSHAAPPLPRDVAPPPQNPEAGVSRPLSGGSEVGSAPARARSATRPAPQRPASCSLRTACCARESRALGRPPRPGPSRLHGSRSYWSEERPLEGGEGTWGRPRQIIVDDDDSKIWSLYDAGPRSIRCPLIFLPPVSGTADVFFRQILALTGWGYRVIALQYPVYWDHLEFCDGFRKLLDHLQLDKVHLFGASLGGFLAQKFAEYTHKSPRVHSLILCNSFSDTSIFNQTWTANSFWLMPAFMLKKIVLGNFSSGPVDPMMADAIDFMVDRLESLGQSELASRLTLNCQNSYVEPHKIRDIPVTIMDVFDQSALSTEAKEEMYKLYPNARRAHLKTGGNFPYLCRSAEVNLYVQIHLLQFHGTKYAAIDPSMVSAEELEVQKGSLGINQEEQ